MQIIASERLAYLSDLLVNIGWEKVTDDHGTGYLAPGHIRSEVAVGYGKGSLHIWDALNAQARFDSFLVSQAKAA